MVWSHNIQNARCKSLEAVTGGFPTSLEGAASVCDALTMAPPPAFYPAFTMSEGMELCLARTCSDPHTVRMALDHYSRFPNTMWC